MGTYVRFSKVYDDVLAGRFANEAWNEYKEIIEYGCWLNEKNMRRNN